MVQQQKTSIKVKTVPLLLDISLLSDICKTYTYKFAITLHNLQGPFSGFLVLIKGLNPTKDSMFLKPLKFLSWD